MTNRVLKVLPASRRLTVEQEGRRRVFTSPARTLRIASAGSVQINTSGGATSHLHTQGSALAVWTVPHNLGRKPSVTVRSVGGVQVLTPEVLHLSDNTLTITFDEPFAGQAYLV